MAQITAAIARTSTGDLQAKLSRLNHMYDRMMAGEVFSREDIMTIPTMQDIDRDMKSWSRKARSAYHLDEVRKRDTALCAYITKSLLQNFEGATEDGAAENYTLLVASLGRYGALTPRYLTQICKELDNPVLTETLCEAADAYLRDRLYSRFEETGLYPEDADLLISGKGDAGTRLNALLRTMPPKLTLVWLSAVECAYTAADRDMFEETEFANRVTPVNAFSRHFTESVDPAYDREQSRQRHEISTALLSMMSASSIQSRARLYNQVLEILAKNKTTPEKFMDTYPAEASKDSIRTCFQAGAIAYAKAELSDMLQAMPLTQDELELIGDDTKSPGDQINALFRNSGDKGNVILTRLEEAMFDIEDKYLARRILFANDQELQQQPSVGQLHL